ncbi:hypothetical protein Leryth_018962 [Lithospermum erythrorhizon]|nr:hypothetical protein Leryth_018962 [Lithospermum erythrorhizon]
MRYDDAIILNCKEDMDKGKTYTYFFVSAQIFDSSDSSSPPYHYMDGYFGFGILQSDRELTYPKIIALDRKISFSESGCATAGEPKIGIMLSGLCIICLSQLHNVQRLYFLAR